MSIETTRPTQRIEFCTDLGLKALHEEHVALLAAATKAAAENPDKRETGNPAQALVDEAAEKVQAIEARMSAKTITFTVEAWKRKHWNEFEASNPARDGHDDDKNLGIDVSALDKVLAGEKTDEHDWPPAIIAVKTKAGEDVPFDPRTEWHELADDMTSGQWNDFALAVLRLNRSVTDAPFSLAASRVTRRSSEN